MSDFLIIGGGVMGLLLARDLLRGGASVTVIDRGRCGGEASWAGGGIVSPLYPWRYNDAVTALASWAQEFYPGLSASLFEETGVDPEFERCGLMMLDAGDASEALAWAERNRRNMCALDTHNVYDSVPGLAQGFDSCLWMPDVANVRNPRLMQALLASVRAMPGARVVENVAVTGLDVDGRGQVQSLGTSTGTKSNLRAGSYIVCAGAWSGQLLSTPAITPVKGQMLLFETPERLLDRIVLYKGRYLIPRRDRHLLVGSTLEYCGFDKQVTEQAMHSLLQSACEILPALADIQPKRQWAGLRPAAVDGVPCIGRVPEYRNLYMNAGHYRNGLVLAPASARLLADLLLGRKPVIDPAPYAPEVRLNGSVETELFKTVTQ